MAGFDLGSILQNATQLLGMQTQLGNQQVGMLNQAQEDVEQIAQQQEEAGLLKTIAERTKLMGELETQQANLSAARSIGTDIGASTDILTPLLVSLREQSGVVSAAQAKVAEIEANSDIINNPMGWLRDLVQGDAARAQLAAATSQFDTTAKQAQAINTLTQTSVQTQNAIKSTLTAESADAQAQAVALDAQIQANATRLKGVEYGINGLQVLREVGAENFRTMTQAYSLMTEEARWQAGHDLRVAQADEMKAVRAERRDDMAYYEKQTSDINRYLAQIKRPEMSVAEVKRALNQPGQYGELLRDYQMRGYRLQETGGLFGMFSLDPFEARNVMLRDRPQLPASYTPASRVLQEVENQFAERVRIQSQSVDKALVEDPQWQRQTYNEVHKAVAAKQTANIQPGTNNPYQIPNITTVLQAEPALAETDFAKKVLLPLASTGKDEVDGQAILATTAKLVQAGELDISSASKAMTDFFKTGTNVRNATSGFMALAVGTDAGYRTKVDALEPSFIQRTGLSTVIPLLSVASAPQQIARAPDKVGQALGLMDKPGVDMGTWYEAGNYKSTLDFTDPKDVTLGLTVMMGKGLYQEILDQNNKVGE